MGPRLAAMILRELLAEYGHDHADGIRAAGAAVDVPRLESLARAATLGSTWPNALPSRRAFRWRD